MDATHKKIRVAAQADLQDGTARIVEAEGRALALFRVEGRCYATQNACPHMGGSLGEGKLKDHVVTCPFHGWTFDVRSGENVRNPRLKKLECFPVSVEDDQVFIELPESPA
jgi:nitrite reductase (NADH) small subunit/3-phenylpropionate/trans-cinnamate dioxygenase ferredoxin subunit